MHRNIDNQKESRSWQKKIKGIDLRIGI